MKPRRRTTALILSFAFAITCLLADSLAWAEFRAAVAVRNVTPDPLLPVSGGVGPSNSADRKAGELTVRAFVLEQGSTRVAICSTDFLGFPGVLCERVRKNVSGVPSENILIGATHTHSAPDCYGFPDREGKTSADLKYLDSVCTGATTSSSALPTTPSATS